jgi:hypothetical protein
MKELRGPGHLGIRPGNFLVYARKRQRREEPRACFYVGTFSRSKSELPPRHSHLRTDHEENRRYTPDIRLISRIYDLIHEAGNDDVNSLNERAISTNTCARRRGFA